MVTALLGGAIGNLIDRVRFGHVIDFVDMGLGDTRWYAWNIADASVSDRIGAGVVLVPEDRKTVGLVPTLSVAHNMVLASLKRYLNRFYLSTGKERDAVTGMIEDLSVRVADPNNSIDSLSGGNQQKVVVAKGLLTEPRVLLLDEPTRGIDVGAKSEIFQIMSRLAQEVVAGDAPTVALNWAREAATMSRGGARSTVSLLRCDDEVLARRLEAEKAAFVRQVRSPEALAGIERFLHRENP